MTHQRTVQGLTFTHVLSAESVMSDQQGAAQVTYATHAIDVSSLRRGVYIVTVNDHIVYVGKFLGSFSKRWLYPMTGTIYHHKRNAIARELHQGSDVRVYAAAEVDLRAEIPIAASDAIGWINVEGIESVLIAALEPAWNG